jgi:tetratricopeptide (TPR) repeat protein
MPSQNIPDFDALWDYSRPDQTEAKFRETLLHIPEANPAFLELLTQIARAQGLQCKFEKAHQTLDQVEKRLGDSASRAKVRYLLERGRVFNSSAHPDKARLLFEQALELARQFSEDFYAVDAIHMLAIISPPDQSLDLNLQAIKMAESSEQERAGNWLVLSRYGRLRVSETRIAVWSVARTLRSLGRVAEALSKQMALKDEFESAGEVSGFVFEEIAECLLLLRRKDEARPYFAKAYEVLSQDEWLTEKELGRLMRLKELGA